MAHTPGIEIRAVTSERLGDVADLFESNGTTKGCWCMFHISRSADFKAGWGAGNRTACVNRPPQRVVMRRDL